MISRTRLFGITLMLYALLSTGLMVFDSDNFTFSLNFKSYAAIGGLLIFICGLVMAARSEFDKMRAIGLYAVSFGIYKILKSLSAMTVDFSNFDVSSLKVVDIISIVSIVFAISLILLGISFLTGLSKKRWTKAIVSSALIVIDVVYVLVFWNDQDWVMVATMVVEALVLVFFVSLMLSKDVALNTEEGKLRSARNVYRSAKRQADKDYEEAKKEAAAAKRAGNSRKAKEILEAAKRRKKRHIAEAKRAANNPEDTCFVYNEEKNRVEVKGKK